MPRGGGGVGVVLRATPTPVRLDAPLIELHDRHQMTDFVLVSVLLVALFLMVFQVGLLFHVRTVIASSAAEGARYGAAANRTPAQGAARPS